MEDFDATKVTLCDAFEKMATNRQKEVSFESAYRSAYLLCLHSRHVELIEITRNWLIAAACYCLTSRVMNTVLLDRSRYELVCTMFRDVLMFYSSTRPAHCPKFDTMVEAAWCHAVVGLPRRVLRQR